MSLVTPNCDAHTVSCSFFDNTCFPYYAHRLRSTDLLRSCRKREKKSPDVKQLLSNAEQHPFSVNQGSWQCAGAGLGPLGSPRQGSFACVCVFSFLGHSHGCSLFLWSLGWLQAPRAAPLCCPGMGRQGAAMCHPVRLVSVGCCTGRVEG